MLINKFWSINWQFYNGDFVLPGVGQIGYIEASQEGSVLGLRNDTFSKETVILEEKKDENDPMVDEQKWLRCEPDTNGYFKLKNVKTISFLCALSTTETKTGKIVKRCHSYVFFCIYDFYHPQRFVPLFY